MIAAIKQPRRFFGLISGVEAVGVAVGLICFFFLCHFSTQNFFKQAL